MFEAVKKRSNLWEPPSLKYVNKYLRVQLPILVLGKRSAESIGCDILPAREIYCQILMQSHIQQFHNFIALVQSEGDPFPSPPVDVKRAGYIVYHDSDKLVFDEKQKMKAGIPDHL